MFVKSTCIFGKASSWHDVLKKHSGQNSAWFQVALNYRAYKLAHGQPTGEFYEDMIYIAPQDAASVQASMVRGSQNSQEFVERGSFALK